MLQLFCGPEKLRRPHAESIGDGPDVMQGDVPSARFDVDEIAAVDLSRLRKLLLREALLPAQLPNRLTEGDELGVGSQTGHEPTLGSLAARRLVDYK